MVEQSAIEPTQPETDASMPYAEFGTLKIAKLVGEIAGYDDLRMILFAGFNFIRRFEMVRLFWLALVFRLFRRFD